MGRKANQAMIGAFVLGAVLLGVAGVVLLSGDRFFRHTETLVAYFEGSLEGLDVGAPVTFNGVRIGSVTDVRVVIDPRDTSIRTPVFFMVDTGRLRDGKGAKFKGRNKLPPLPILIEHGLRARLELQSLVTGQLVVALNFYPGTQIRLKSPSKHFQEIPTIPSSFDTVTKALENLPIETLVAQTIRTMQSLEALATAPEVRATLTDLDKTLREVRAQVNPLATTVRETAGAAQRTLAEADRTMADMRATLAQLTPPATATLQDYQRLAQDARTLVAHADAKLETVSKSLETTLADAHGLLGDDSPVRYDLANALQEMTKAARSLRALADYLDRHPEALVTGKRADTGR
jgi:paraquat-inducible protein B